MTPTFAAIEALATDELRPLLAELRVLILEVHPDACETVRPGDRAATYGTGPRKMKDGYAYLMPHKQWVNLGFYQGARLPDPTGLLEGTGKQLRHVKVRNAAMTRQPALRALLAVALAERRKTNGLVG